MSNKHQDKILSTKNAPHYTWGNQCDGWWLHQTDKFTVIRENMPPNTSEQKHYHDNTEQFFYCLEGTLCIEMNGDSYILNPNEGLAIPAKVEHQVINQSTMDIKFLVISCPNAHHDRVNIK